MGKEGKTGGLLESFFRDGQMMMIYRARAPLVVKVWKIIKRQRKKN